MDTKLIGRLEGQNVYQTLSGLSMASPFSILEKQILLEAKSLSERTTKFEEIKHLQL